MDPAALDVAMSQHPGSDASAQESLLNPNVLPLSAPPLPEGQAASTRPSRKRTKTGCLTCRKRRIKCGEERPTCNNCIKSKRHCEGYNQRVVFKDHLSAYRHGSLAMPPEFSSTLLYPQPSMPGAPQLGPYESSSFAGPVSLPALAPRPSASFVFTAHPGWPVQPGPAAPDPGHADAASCVLPAAPGVAQQECLVSPTSHAYPPMGQSHIPSEQPALFEQSQQHHRHTKPSPIVLQPPHFASSAANPTTSIPHEAAFDPPYPSPLEGNRFNPPAPVSRPSGIPTLFADAPLAIGSTDGGVGHSYQTQLTLTYLSRASIDSGREPITPTTTPPSYNPAYATPRKPSGQMKPEEPAQVFGAPGPLNTAANTSAFVARAEAYTPIPRTFPVHSALADDTATGFNADEDIDIDLSSPDDVAHPAEYIPNMPDSVGSLVARHTSSDDRAARTLTDWLNEPNLLATYHPSPLASQLMDPKAARIFCHFITSTGPAFSIYERHPVNPSVIFMGGPVPSSQKSLWAYTLPTLALSSPALMHAMLALGALHISKLQGGTTTVSSLKHYHLALRRVARQVSLPAKRGEVATLAATLLLGLWEVMATEHSKWNSHLLGARQLLDEYDFAGMTKRIKQLRIYKDTQRRQWHRPESDASVAPMQSDSVRKVAEEASFASIQDIDEDLVGIFMGQAIRYDGLGVVKIETDDPAGGVEPELTRHDVEDYEVRRDLFWWFAKQDMYQSLLSGNRLLSDYSRWSHCPPRAAIGRRDAPYGSSDHMILLLGRIADFSARDQRRKRRVMMEAAAGRGQPLQAGQMHAGAFPPQQTMQMGPNVAGAQQHPVMYGMIPQPTAARCMPAGFQLGGGGGNASPGSNASDDFELEVATAEAEDEWVRVRHALDLFAECLASPHFQPLAAEHMPPAATPFGGPAVFYRTYSIACIWALFHVAHIVLQRAHPSMPPAALAAAAVAAPQTARHAAAIGRIAAALFPADLRAPISPGLGAALSELSLSLFFAGVQFSDGAQRVWLATSLRHLARQTGWDSIAAIAAGCETAWVKAAQMGRGPPYAMEPDQHALSEHIAGRGPHPAVMKKKAAALVSDYDDDDSSDVGGPLNPGLRVHRALGILGVEADLEQLSLD